MKDMIYRYLRWGNSTEFPERKKITLNDMSFEDTKEELSKVVEKCILKIENPDECIFQLSGGFDSSVLVSYFPNSKTFCTGRPGSSDQSFSQKVADYFNCNHMWNGYDKMLDHLNLKEIIIKINEMNPWPRSFKNDLGLYSFSTFIKNHTDHVASGKGVEFQLFGYFTIFNTILENAIATGEYSIPFAKELIEHRVNKCPKDMWPLNLKNMMKFAKSNKKYNLDMVGWWPGNFTKEQTMKFMNYEIDEPEFESMYDITSFVLDWFGEEYVNNRLETYSKNFGITFHTPYIDDEMISFVRTIPIEMKKCMEYHKYIFYQAMSHRVPEFVIERPKSGLNTSPVYFIKNFDKIAELIGIYLRFNNLKIFQYIDFDETQKFLLGFKSNFDKTFKQIWSLLNLSIWLEIHNSDD